ncbi:uncharacterized protein NPIL_110581 [Nephila pilipes]|uniref:Uncharacterized protein n=1 Tax=Nephila pilipes TaxID=299642 RepID=A0A8X6IQF5_NEPPI|nr:uncharacterized protein NPIL_110581 [Nephila pilipes]
MAFTVGKLEFLHLENLNPPPKRRNIQCYGSGTLGSIQSKCRSCSISKEEKNSVNKVILFTVESPISPSNLIVLIICGMEAAVCADTGASHFNVGEKFYLVANRSANTYDIADPSKPDEVLRTNHIPVSRAYELPVSGDSGTAAPLRKGTDVRNLVLTIRRDILQARGGVCSHPAFNHAT